MLLAAPFNKKWSAPFFERFHLSPPEGWLEAGDYFPVHVLGRAEDLDTGRIRH